MRGVVVATVSCTAVTQVLLRSVYTDASSFFVDIFRGITYQGDKDILYSKNRGGTYKSLLRFWLVYLPRVRQPNVDAGGTNGELGGRGAEEWHNYTTWSIPSIVYVAETPSRGNSQHLFVGNEVISLAASSLLHR